MKKEIKIALVAIVALIALFYGLNFLKGSQIFSDNSEYVLAFHNVAGVAKNCPIYADGIVVGTVGNITYDYTHQEPTKVVALLRKKLVVPAGTRAEVKTDLMGNTQINLLLGDDDGEPLPPGGTIYGKEDDGLMDHINTMLPTLEGMLPKVDSILATVNSLVGDPAVRDMLANADALSVHLTTASAQLATLLTQLNDEMPALLATTGALLANADTLSAQLVAADLEGTLNDVHSTIASLQGTVDKLSSPEGTVGKLLCDSTLYDNLAATMADADSLLIDLKAHPKRYVHFSVFGKKN